MASRSIVANLIHGQPFDLVSSKLNVSAYELRRGGHPVHLERQPMDLLILLVERHRQLVWAGPISQSVCGIRVVFVDIEMGVNTAIP